MRTIDDSAEELHASYRIMRRPGRGTNVSEYLLVQACQNFRMLREKINREGYCYRSLRDSLAGPMGEGRTWTYGISGSNQDVQDLVLKNRTICRMTS